MKVWRSLVFWGGLVVMGFIGWAWRDSLSTTTAGGHTWLHVENYASRVSFTHQWDGMWHTGWGGYRERWGNYPAMYGGMGFRSDWLASGGRKIDFWISHWYLLIGTGAVWVGCLWWNWWRVKRVKRGIVELPVEGGEG
jgi:hypothetical protein